MQNKLFTKFEKIGIRAIKNNNEEKLEDFLDKIAKGEEE